MPGIIIGIADVVEADRQTVVSGIGIVGRQVAVPCSGSGVSSRAKMRLVEVMPFIATWKNEPS